MDFEALWRRYETLVSERSVAEAHWTEIDERVAPQLSGRFFNQRSSIIEGDKRTSKLFDSTAAQAALRFASMLESMLTPRNSRWHRLRSSEESLNKLHRVRQYFEDVTNLLFKYRYSPRANFASQKFEEYYGLGIYGTGALYVDAMKTGPGIRYRALHLSNYYLMENHQGIIDAFFRPFKYTVRQMVQRWGEDAMPERVQNDYRNGKLEQKYDLLHYVAPREDFDPTRLDSKNMPFASIYFFVPDRKVIAEGGFNTFPLPVSRYITAPGELYGRSPASMVLPSIKTLNEEKKTVLKQGQRIVDPVLLMHDDGVLNDFSLRPGALNRGGVSAEGRPLVHTLPTGNIAVGIEMMQEERTLINDVFLVTLFQILTESTQMTATEVLERTREKGILLSPTMGRQQSESLGPLITRELDLLSQQGLLPDMPPELIEAEGEFDIEYDSPLSRAQKAEETVGLFRTIEAIGAYVSQTGDTAGGLSMTDHIDLDKAMPDIMRTNAVPEKWQRAAETIQAIRQQRAQQQQTQQMIEAAPALAGLAKAQK